MTAAVTEHAPSKEKSCLVDHHFVSATAETFSEKSAAIPQSFTPFLCYHRHTMKLNYMYPLLAVLGLVAAEPVCVFPVR